MTLAQARAAALVRIATGVVFVAEGYSKVAGRFIHGGFEEDARSVAAKAWPVWSRFLHGTVLPQTAAFAWLVAAGELALGLALVLGLWTRVACTCGTLLVISFLLGQFWVPGGSWDHWVTAGLTSKFGILTLALLGIVDAGKAWGLDGRVRSRKGIRAPAR